MALNKDRSTTTGEVFSVVSKIPAVQSLQWRVEAGGALSFSAVNAGAQPFFAALLAKIFPQRTIVLVTAGLKIQEMFQQDVETWNEFEVSGLKFEVPEAARVDQLQTSNLKPQTFFYPAWEILPHEAKLPHVDVISERLETLVALSDKSAIGNSQSAIITTSVSALLQKTFPRGEIEKRTRVLKRGDKCDPLDLIEWLEDQGYEPEADVTQKGEIASRGGILDVWPLTSPWPVRLEFFGDELESLRYFDPLTQISREEISGVTIPPGGELGILKKLRATGDEVREKSDAAISPGENLVTRHPSPATLLDHLPSETIFVFCEPELLDAQAELYEEQVPADDPFFISWEEFQEQLAEKNFTVIELSEAGNLAETEILESEISDFKLGNEEELKFQSLEIFRPIGDRAPEPHIAEAQRKEFFTQLHRWLRQDYAVHVFCNNDGERQRFEEIWQEYGFGNSRESKVEGREPEDLRPSVLDSRPSTHLGALTRGFLCDAAKLVVVTDAEIFGRYKIQRPRRLKSPHAQTSKSLLDINFAELEEGDYVVHLQHGIGRYLGLQKLATGQGRKNADGSLRSESEMPGSGTGILPVRETHRQDDRATMGEECLVIEYAASDPKQPAPKLYVPVSEAHLVSKYVGAGKARPPLNQLGGTRWAKTKAQAENAVRDLAAEMLRIQAARESQAGFAFPADIGWQREFENSFIYEETPDQWRAIVQTKKDLESTKPMDRLICGDVGYGKTEVAIRAAFKAALSGKQVAILVPTTVLAQQHFNTFRERMADYPVKIELLSRFRTRRAQERAIKDLAKGAVDIVIGTHRLLQKDIAFKDLGLVVIDEEQRFGVMHKEKFKQLRTLVDVLTLSATPIPRTLYLALAGARDMSTIETPPQDRLPVETIVTQYDERVIRDAIQRELNRGGQVFYLHNRVFDIEAVAHRLRTLVPHARIGVGHGQMHADELEEVMTQFVNGEMDVLLSTTIIESGLDIPNANTIIIDRADRFGLSDLYQLRGRVGRYKHQAYAYLLLPRHAGLLVDARKRISAIKQYSSLGSGFKIAMRDLEIRGAGNLLGSQQSGHITAVGFELYCQLLKQSVSTLKGEKVKPRVEVEARLDFLSGEEREHSTFNLQRSTSKELQIHVPRDVATVCEHGTGQSESSDLKSEIPIEAAFIPLNYIPEAQHRIEIYRKLAQVLDKAALETLKRELRDRFGPMPAAVDLLLKVTELKILARDKNVSVIETKEDKLMLTRNNDFLMVNGKFPRLTKRTAAARLGEIKRLLLAL